MRPRSLPAQVALLFRNLRAALGLAFGVNRPLVVAYLLLGGVEALLPVGMAWVGKQIVDAVVVLATSTGPRDPTSAIHWVVVEGALAVAMHGNAQAIGWLAEVLRLRMALHIELLVADKAQRLSVRHFEDPEFMNMLERARKDATWRPIEMITHGVALVRHAITLAGFAFLLSGLSGLAVIALASAAFPFLAEAHYAAVDYERRSARTSDERKSGYYLQALTSDYLVKEIKLFGIAAFFRERYRAIAERFIAEDRGFTVRRGRAVTILGALSAIAFYGVLARIVILAAEAALSLGAMTMYLVVLRQAQGAFRSAMSALANVWSDSLYMGNLFAYLAIEDDDVAALAPAGALPGEKPKALPLRFENVSFAYPGSARPALDDVSLDVRAGEVVALVGPNGAGKTTLVKLLTALYRPTAGKVLLGDDDVGTLDPGEVRRRIGVVFQDFVHYHLTARENVGIGWVPAMDDPAAVTKAAADGGATEVVASLPKGMDTMLGRWFGGEQLSIGQWQRVALARAFMRRSGVLVLDEPTASIDAEGEYEIFERLQRLAEGRTVLLITHRFSSVRMANRIVVLDKGKVAEIGTHDALIAKGGLYAKMFAMQAKGYLDAGEGATSTNAETEA
jgi:ABC-type multidrug transport system fused ATPase/permease subunit